MREIRYQKNFFNSCVSTIVLDTIYIMFFVKSILCILEVKKSPVEVRIVVRNK